MLAKEAEKAAPIASKWCGYEIPPWIASPLAHREAHHHNSCENCDGGSPGTRKPNGETVKRNDRAGGFFGISAPAVEFYGVRLGYSVPRRADFLDRDEWTKATCRWLVSHPKEQVWILFRMIAWHLPSAQGNLYRLFSIYKSGEDVPLDYTYEAVRIWHRLGWPWPPDGNLPRLR